VKSNFFILCLSIFAISCTSGGQGLNSLSRNQLVSKGEKDSHEYMGEREILKDARDIAEELLRRDPNDYDGLLLKSWVVIRDGFYNSVAGYNPKNLETSYQLISKAISLRQNDWRGWKYLTLLFINAKKSPEAKKFYQKFQKLNLSPNDKNYLYYKTIVGMEISFLDKEYEKVLLNLDECKKNSIDKFHVKNCLDLTAQTYFEMKNFKQQLEIRQELLKYFPENSWTNGNLGGAYFNLKDYPNAINYYEKALELKDYGLARASLGSLYAALARQRINEGKNEEAHDFMDKLLKLGVHSESTGLFASTVSMRIFKDMEMTEEILLNGIENMPENGKLRAKLGKFYKDEKNYEKALQTFVEVFNGKGWDHLDSEEKVLVANQIAWLNLWGLKEPKIDVAIEVLDKVRNFALQNKFTKGQYFYFLASAYHEKGWREKSILLSRKSLEIYDQALEFYPENKSNIQRAINNVTVNIRSFKKQGFK